MTEGGCVSVEMVLAELEYGDGVFGVAELMGLLDHGPPPGGRRRHL